jgi:AmiR/NasT family two-component response regulator
MKTTREIRVLIAEDDAMVSMLTQAELESIGMTVVGTAFDGQVAAEMTRELKPDVVLMDITMPHMDGIDAAAVIQAECPTPMVILSAHDQPELVVRATAAGAGAFVLKPPQAAELERAITIAVARHADLIALRRMNSALEQALAEVKTLKGLLPICCQCKKVRDDNDYWNDVEVYLMKHTDAEFTHAYCPVCLEKHFARHGGPE